MASTPVAEHNLGCLSTVASGPKWTMGGRLARQSQGAPVPGPGAYNPHFEVTRLASPKFGFGSETRGGSLTAKSAQPGPGSYNPQVQRGRQAASWTIAGRTTTVGGRSITPGPGAYSSVIPKSSAPAFGLGTAQRGTFSAPNSPGPGAYDPKWECGPRAPQWSIEQSKRSSFGSTRVSSPGPGAYSPNTNTVGPMYTMGGRRTSQNKQLVPGPGAYTPRCPEKESNKFSFGGRTPLLLGGGDAPGPGAYTPAEGSIKQKAPAWCFGNEKRGVTFKSGTPGPGQYDPLKKPGAPAWSFGGGAKIGRLSPTSSTPAPGTYNISSTVGQGAKYSMRGGGNRGIAPLSDSPGPCSYAPNLSDASPKWSFGTSVRSNLTPVKVTPGPGAYSLPSTQQGIGWTMSGRHGRGSSAGMKPTDGGGQIGTTYSTFGFL